MFNRRNLERAFEIGDFRRTGMDDGNIARILWKQAFIISDDPLDISYVPRDAAEKRTQALLMRTKVEQKVKAKFPQPSLINNDPLDILYVPPNAAEKDIIAHLVRTKTEPQVNAKSKLSNPEDSEELGFDKLVCLFYR